MSKFAVTFLQFIKEEIMNKIIYLATTLKLTTTTALAGGGQAGKTALVGKVGTLGLGLEIIKPITATIGARVGINYLSVSRSDSYGGVDYDSDLDMQTVELLADWHPYGSKFFISAGAMINRNKINAIGAETGTVIVGNNTFIGNAQFNTDVKFDTVSPYLGVGYRKRLAKKGLSFVAEAGVLFQGSPEVKLDVQAPASASVTQNDVDIERQQIQDDIDDIKNWPVVSVGFFYQF